MFNVLNVHSVLVTNLTKKERKQNKVFLMIHD